MSLRKLAGGPFRLVERRAMADREKPKGLFGRVREALGRWTRRDAAADRPEDARVDSASVTLGGVGERPVFETAEHPLMHGCPPDWASGWGEDRYGLWVDLTLGEVSQRLRWIGPGRFLMGSPPEEPGRFDNEGPQHEVRLSSGCWLFDTPVTQALWTEVMGDSPSRHKGPAHPVDSVSWDDAQRFMERINKQVAGLDLVLPTEAQWEYACRAGTATPNYAGGEQELTDIAWFAENSNGQPHPVAAKRCNAWGLYDMLGNVWEWCADDWRNYQSQAVVDPVGPDGAFRALRGGAWFSLARYVRSAGRSAFGPDFRSGHIGFRCARVRP
jgi:hypothetical protein